MASCPPGSICLPPSLASVQVACPIGYTCPLNTPPQICPKGFFCASSTVPPVPCPSDFFCPTQSHTPIPCPPLSSCDAGAGRYLFWGALFFLPLIFAALFVIRYYLKRSFSLLSMSNPAPPSSPSSSSFASSSSSSSALFHRNILAHSDKNSSIVTPGNHTSHPNGLDIRFQDLALSLSVNGFPKQILETVSGHFEAGKVSIVLGSSGAGKSTFFSLLNGVQEPTGGTLTINGQVEKSAVPYRRRIGFVPQEDVVLHDITVLQAISHSAFCRLPSDWTTDKKLDRVEDVIQTLGLSHVKHSLVGKVSGGERKRVNMGLELVAEVSCLLLDEVTTGLDSSAALEVMTCLRRIASQSVTVVAILHTPRNEIFEMADTLLLLGRGGHTVYSGPVSGTAAYFEEQELACPKTTSLADHLLDLCSGKIVVPKEEAEDEKQEEIEAEKSKDRMPRSPSISEYQVETEWQNFDPLLLKGKWLKYAASKSLESLEIDANNNTTPSSSPPPSKQHRPSFSPPSFLAQTLLCCRRNYAQLGRNFDQVIIDAFVHVLAGLVLGLAFFSEDLYVPPIPRQYAQYCPSAIRNAFCFVPKSDAAVRLCVYTAMCLGIVASTIATRSLSLEKTIFWRETSSGHSAFGYFVSKNLTELPLIAMHSLCYSLAFFLVCAPRSPFAAFWACIFMYEIILWGIGHACSALLPFTFSPLAAAIIAMLLGLGTGAVNSVKSMGVLGYFSSSRWLAETMYTTEVQVTSWTPSIQGAIRECADNSWGYSFDSFDRNFVAMFIHALCYRALAYILLRRINASKQR